MVFTGLLLPQALLSCGLKVGPGFKERDFDAHSPLVCPLSSFAASKIYFYFRSKWKCCGGEAGWRRRVSTINVHLVELQARARGTAVHISLQ